MKFAHKEYKHEWEEAQLLHLILLYERLLRYLKLTLNLALFLIYVVLKLAWNMLKIATVPPITEQLVRDEAWIYRHIK